MGTTSEDLLSALNKDVINEAFDIARTNIGGMIASVSMGDSRLAEGGYKFNWLDMRVDAGGSAVNGAILAAATTLTVDDGKVFRAGMLISVKDSSEVMLVTAVSGDELTVTRGFGGTTAVDIADNAIVTIDSVGREENSLGAADGILEPTEVENYFQTFDTMLDFSRRMLSTAQSGNMNDLTTQLAERFKQLAIQQNRALIRGRKATGTVNSKTVSFTGGIGYFLDQTGAYSADNSAAALTEAKINDIVEQIVLRGGTADCIAVNTRLARKINDIIKANYSSQRLVEYTKDQGGVTELPSDLPLAGFVTKIVLDTNINDDELIIYDSGKIKIVPMAAGNGDVSGEWRTVDATQKGQDGVAARVIGDYGFEVRQSQTHMARLTNIG